MKKEAILIIAFIGVVAIGGGIWFATTLKPTTTITTGATTTGTQQQNNGALSWASSLLSGLHVSLA